MSPYLEDISRYASGRLSILLLQPGARGYFQYIMDVLRPHCLKVWKGQAIVTLATAQHGHTKHVVGHVPACVHFQDELIHKGYFFL